LEYEGEFWALNLTSLSYNYSNSTNYTNLKPENITYAIIGSGYPSILIPPTEYNNFTTAIANSK
jgi:hypothetical protein